jgi:hypothetical protein
LAGTATFLRGDVADKWPEFDRAAEFALGLPEVAFAQDQIAVTEQLLDQRRAETEARVFQVREHFPKIDLQIEGKRKTLMQVIAPVDQWLVARTGSQHRHDRSQEGRERRRRLWGRSHPQSAELDKSLASTRTEERIPQFLDVDFRAVDIARRVGEERCEGAPKGLGKGLFDAFQELERE